MSAGDVRVSVIVPFRNAANDLPKAFAQLAALAGPVEILLVDDASTDGGDELAAAFCEQDARVRLLRRASAGGSTRARMTGVAAAVGEYVWFCDADDEWEPDIVMTLLAETVVHGADLVACRAERIEADGRRWVMEGAARPRTVAGAEAARLVWRGELRGYLWNKLIRRSCIPPLRREPLSSQDDFLMMLDIVERVGCVRLVPDVKYRYLERAGSISTGRALDLANTARCAEEARRRFAPMAPAARRSGEIDAFELWFHLVPSIATPVHRGWPTAEEVRRELAPRITWRAVVRLAARQPSVAAHAALIRLSGRRYPAGYRLARRATGLLRRGGRRAADAAGAAGAAGAAAAADPAAGRAVAARGADAASAVAAVPETDVSCGARAAGGAETAETAETAT